MPEQQQYWRPISHRLREQLAEDFRELAQMSEAEKDYYSGQDRRRHD